MKKFLTLTTVVTLLVAGTAMAADRGEWLFIQPNATFATPAPTTTNNDDSCDVGNAPAATLLLPFFSVDTGAAATNENTIFTLVNTSQYPQIAHITVWTDWSFPVLDFNIFLTGYDVQGISLRDIIVNGQIPPTGALGTISPRGALSIANTQNPNFNVGEVIAAGGCASLAGPIPPNLRADVQSALTVGTYGAALGAVCAQQVGGNNGALAQGYLTIDVVDSCSQLLPTDPTFYTSDILWDNTLTGDYQIISVAGQYAGGESLVSVRAIPEGGNPRVGALVPGGLCLQCGPNGANTAPPAGFVSTNFPFTFYDRYTAGNATGIREIDRRMPLPGVFAARFIEDVPTGPTGFVTDMQIWREGRTAGRAPAAAPVPPTSSACTTAVELWAMNSNLPATRLVRFDERENPTITGGGCPVSPCPPEQAFTFEEASRPRTSNNQAFPPDFPTTADLGGWMYLNLNGNGCGTGPSAGITPQPGTGLCSDRPGGESQNWVTVAMSAEAGRFAATFDATWLQNGCTEAPLTTAIIGPGPNTTLLTGAPTGFPAADPTP